MRRTFSAAQKREAWLRQGGKCTWCAEALAGPMEGHHDRLAWRQGGPTDHWNCEVLHPQCHDLKESVLRDLRDWQRDMLTIFKVHDRQAFLIQAPVGSGKTAGALACYAAWKSQQSRPPLCVIVAPSVNVLRKWVAEVAPLGRTAVRSFDLDDREVMTPQGKRTVEKVDVVPPPDLAFWGMSYQAVEGSAEVLRRVGADRPVIVIADEIHRTESSENTAWGPACERAFDNANQIVCLSATPFRTSGRPISFLRYAEGYAEPDYRLSWKHALDEKYIVPLEFAVYDQQVGWTRRSREDGSTFSIAGRISDARLADAALGRALSTDELQDALLAEGARCLATIRKRYPEAAGMVICDFQDQAQQLAARLNRRGEPAFAAITDLKDSQAKMDALRDGRIDVDWMVTVGMAREGCDIPRLKVLVWLSRVKTLQNFIQVSGRVVRQVDVPGVSAYSILPAHPILVDYARHLLEEQGDPLRDRESDDTNGGPPPEPKSDTVSVHGEPAEPVEAIHGGGDPRPLNLRMLAIAERRELPITLVEEIIRDYEHGGPEVGERPVDAEAIRRQVKDCIRRVARRYPEKTGVVVNELKMEAGTPLAPIESYSVDELIRLREALTESGF